MASGLWTAARLRNIRDHVVSCTVCQCAAGLVLRFTYCFRVGEVLRSIASPARAALNDPSFTATNVVRRDCPDGIFISGSRRPTSKDGTDLLVWKSFSVC